MPHNSITRLRLRSFFTLPAFLNAAQRINTQLAGAPGFLGGATLPEGRMVFWTRSAWTDADAMKAFRDSGAHRDVMPKLKDWCDEASIAQWQGEAETDWEAIYARMVSDGRSSRVRRPTEAHMQKRFSPIKRWAPEQVINPGS
jgi:hypothetical protein